MNYFDLHCDTISECYNNQGALYRNKMQLSLHKGSNIKGWVQTYAIWLSDELSDEAAYTYFNRVYGYFLGQIQALQEHICFCKNSVEIQEALNKCKRVALLSIEGSRPLGHSLERVQEFYDLGVRMMTLTWNESTAVADGCMVENAKGLTIFGKKVVRKMAEIGMLVDVSHLAEVGFWDVVNTIDRPFIATHSNSKTICNHPRNLTDDQFKVFVERKGLVGMNFYPLFINNTMKADIQELLLHIDHFVNLGGKDVIAMGSDFDGISVTPAHVSGIQEIDYLYRLLVKRYGKRQADQFFFENAYRFMSDNLK